MKSWSIFFEVIFISKLKQQICKGFDPEEKITVVTFIFEKG
jgi:hypothetical protein